MSITIPPEITWLFPIVVGESWPEGDEDKLRALGDAWRAGGVDVGEVITQAKTAADQAMAGMEGEAAEAFERYFNQFVEGSEAYLTQLQEACEGLGDSCDNCALEVEYAKYSIIAALILLAIEIAALIAAAFGTFGASTAGIPIAQAATRITVQMIFRRLIMAILKEVLIEVGIDVAIQGLQMAKGDRTSWDWNKTGGAALSGAISGAIGGGMDFIPTRATGLGGNIAEGAIRGGVEGVASTVATAAITGQDITGGDLLRAGVSGGVGGSIGGATNHFDTPTVNTPDSSNIPGGPGTPPSPGSPPGSPGSPPGSPSPSGPDGPGSSTPPPGTPGNRTPDNTTSASGLTPPPDGPGSSNTPGSSTPPPRIPTSGPDGPSQHSPGGFTGGQQGGPSQSPGGAPRPGGPAPSSPSGFSGPGSSPGSGGPGSGGPTPGSSGGPGSGGPSPSNLASGSPGSGGPGSGSPGSGGPGSGSPGSGGPGSGGPGSGGPGSGGPGSGGPGSGSPGSGGPTPGSPGSGVPGSGGPTPGSPGTGAPGSGGPTPGSPGGPAAGGPTPGSPSAGSPMAGGPSAGGPTPGGPSAGGPAPSNLMSGGPSAGGPTPGGPTPGSPIGGSPMPGGPTPGGPSAGGPAPSGPAPSGPAPGGFPNAGGPTPNTGGFGPTGGYSGDGPGGNNQGGAGPIGGAPMGGAPGSGGPGGRQNDGSTYTTTGASTATPSAFADTGSTHTDPRGGGPSDRMPEQRGVPQQPNQAFTGAPAPGGFGPQPGGPQPGGPAPQQGGQGPRPPFGPGANPGQGFGPRPDAGGPRPTGPDALNRPPQSGQPQPGGPAPRPGTGPQPGSPARPDAGPRPDGTPNRPDPSNRTDTPARPDTGPRPDGTPNRPDASTQPDAGPRPDSTPARPDGTPNRPDATNRPDTTRPDGNRPGTTPPRPDGTPNRPDPSNRTDTPARPDSTPNRPDASTQPDTGPRPDGTPNRPDPSNRTDTPARPDTGPRPDAGPRPDSTPNRPDTTDRTDTDTRPDGSPEPGRTPEPDVSRSPEPDVSRSPEPDVSRSPDDDTTTDTTPDTDQPTSGDDDSDGPTPDDDSPDDTDDTDDTDAPATTDDADDGPKVDEEGVPLNYLGNRHGEHEFAVMGDYIPMGGDRSNGMGSYDQRVAPLIGDHNPWGSHGSLAEFNANHRPDGTFATNRWPDNDGAVPGSERQVTLPPGTVIDRFGAESGRFFSPLDTNGQPYHYRDRAIFPDNAQVGYHVYVVTDPNGLTGELADVAPALGQPGGGRQFTIPPGTSIPRLIDDGVLTEVTYVPSDGRVLPESFGHDNGDGTQNTDTISLDDAANATPEPTPDTTPPLSDNLQQVADNSSFRTPAGGALFDPSDVRTRDAANAVAPIDGHFILDVHSDGQHAIVDGQRLNGQDLADLARHMGWNGTDPIILNGCEAGRSPDGLAADLARAADARVIAPTERSWSGEQNTTPYSSSVDSVDESGRARPTIPPDGGWRSFDPDGTMQNAGSNGLPVDTRTPDTTPDTAGTPGDGPAPDTRQPLPHGDDVDRGRIQSPFTPPRVTDPDAPHTIRVDDNAASSADPNDPHRPLRGDERLIGRDGLNPNSQYQVPGRGTYYTNGDGVITHADLEVANRTEGITEAGANVNPDASYPEANTTYRITVDGAEHIYTTDDFGLPPRYQTWTTPSFDQSFTVPSNDPSLPADSPLRTAPTPPHKVALSDRTDLPPNAEIIRTDGPNGQVTRLYTGPADPQTGGARVVAIDTWSSPGSGNNNTVRAADLNPELNNFPPNTITRINGEDVYLTNQYGVTTEATDRRDYSQNAPRSDKAQKNVKKEGGSTDVDGGHIRPTQGGGAPDARNQFPQLSTENRTSKGNPADQIWYGQDMAAARQQQDHGVTHEWHDLQTEGSHPTAPARPQVVHERWVMRDSNGRIRLHFRRYDN